MQTALDTALSKKYLIVSLLAVAIVILGANFVSIDLAILVGNLSYIPTTGAFSIMAILIALRFRLAGNHGLAWFSFAAFALSWSTADLIWVYQELYLKEDPFPSPADIFYIIGYPFLLMFLISYLQPVRSSITRKMFTVSSAISIGILIPSLYLVLGNGIHIDSLSISLGVIYPIFDAMVIIPAMIGVALFFKGKVSLMWTLICLGILCSFIVDIAFLFKQNEDSYYTGNPVDILFHWTYVLLAFGVYGHLSLFKKENPNK